MTVPPVTVPPAPPPPVASPPLPVVPQPVPDAARRLLELANLERQRAGLAPLRTRDDVTAIALAHSHRMALAGDIFHNRSYFSRAARRQLKSVFRGENVAYNGSVEVAHARLMRSPGHRANLLNRRFSVVGIAVVQASDGRYFITEDFLQPVRPPRTSVRPAR
ncbi:MAG: CAP domain-containing protein [Acidimicrobiales bacterium]